MNKEMLQGTMYLQMATTIRN